MCRKDPQGRGPWTILCPANFPEILTRESILAKRGTHPREHPETDQMWMGRPRKQDDRPEENHRLVPICVIFVVKSLSHVHLFATQWTAAHQASLSFTNSWSLLKLMSVESMMPSTHLILCCPLFLLPSIFPSIKVLSNDLALRIRWPKYWSFSFSIYPSNEYSELISFRVDGFVLAETALKGCSTLSFLSLSLRPLTLSLHVSSLLVNSFLASLLYVSWLNSFFKSEKSQGPLVSAGLGARIQYPHWRGLDSVPNRGTEIPLQAAIHRSHHPTATQQHHNLLSARWRYKRAKVKFPSEFEGLRTRGAKAKNFSPSTGEDEMRCPSSTSEAGKLRGGFILLPPLVLPKPWRDWMMEASLERTICFTEPTNSNVNVIQKYPPTPKGMLNLGPPWPVKLAHKINHHSG